jgi:hypothetical protein
MESIMKKISFFLIGMTSLALAFAMIGCDNGTTTKTETVYVPGGNSGPGQTVNSEDQLRIAISKGTPGVYRIVSSFDLKTPLIVNEGQHIVVGGTSGVGEQSFSVGSAVDGPLFAASGSGTTFNIGAKLTLKSGASFTIVHGAAVNATSTGELHVSKGAAVGVGVEVGADAELGDDGSEPTLHIAGGGKLVVEPYATLAVPATANSVVLEAPDSGLELAAKSKLAVEGILGGDVIGESGVIVIPADAGAEVAIYDVDVYTDAEAAKADAASGSSDSADPALTTSVANKAEEVSKGDVDVSALYTLSAVSGVNPAGLKIASAIKNLAKDGVDAGLVTITLTGEAGVVVTHADLLADMYNAADVKAEEVAKGISAVVITGLVNVEQTGRIKQTNEVLRIWKNANLIGGTITDFTNANVTKDKVYAASIGEVTGTYHPASIGGFDIILWGGATRKTITLEITQPYTDNSTDDDGPTQTFLIDYSAVTFTHTDTEKAAIELAKALGGGLAAGSTSVSGNTVTLTDDVTLAASDKVTVPKDVTLVVAGSKTLDLSALFTDNSTTDKPVALAGEIVVENTGILNLSQGDGSALPREIDWTAGGKLTIFNGGKVTLASIVSYIGTSSDSNPIYQWTDAYAANTTAAQNVTLNGTDGITMNANITANAFPSLTGQTTNFVRGKNTISEGFTLTVGTKELKVSSGSGNELIVKGTVSLASEKVLSIDPTAKLTVAATGTIAHTTPGTVKFKVYKLDPDSFAWVPSQATVEKSDTNWTVTQVTSDPTANFEIILGKVKVTGSGANTGTGIETTANTGVQGSITTDAATIVTFEGAT